METKIKIFNGSRREILAGILAISLVFSTFSLPQAENLSADISTFELDILDNVKPELTQKTADAENLIKKDTDTLTTDSKKFKSEIPKDSENSLMLGNSDREELRYFNHGARIVNGTFSGNKIIYKDIWSHTDLLVTTLENGIKEDLILKNNQAPLQFEYLVETVGLRLELTPDGGFEFLDRFGKKKFYTPAPDLTDATGQKITTGISYDLNWEKNTTSITADSIQQIETEAEEIIESENSTTLTEEVSETTPTEEVVQPIKIARPRVATPVETETTLAEEAGQSTTDSIQQTETEAEEVAEPEEIVETEETSETLTEPVVEASTEEINTTPIDEITVVEEAETTLVEEVLTEETPAEEVGQSTTDSIQQTEAEAEEVAKTEEIIELEETSETPTEPVVEDSAEPETIETEETSETPVEEINTTPIEETPAEEIVEPAEEIVEVEPIAFFQNFLPKFLRADILATGRQDFENSTQNSEQLRQADGSILRRYKLKLTVTNVANLTYPLDLDPSTFVQTSDESIAQAAEEVSDPTAAVTTIGRNLTTNDLTVRGTLTTSGTNLSIDSGLFYMDSVNDRVGIGTTAPLSKLGLLGNFSIGATYGAIAAPTSGLIVEGNVGIGVTAPLSKLGLLGNFSIGATYGAIAAPTSGLIVEGNVGIGVTVPNSKLEISGDIRIATGSGGQIFFADGSSMSSAALGSSASLSNTTDAIITSDSDVNASGDIILKTGNSDRLHILNNGNVGIGTTAPAVALDVDGQIRVGQVTTANMPTCNSSNLGSFIFDTDNDRPYTCTAAGGGNWKPLDSDYDKDGITDTIDTDDTNANDATAVAADVLSGKTLYAGGASVTGSLANCSSEGSQTCYATGTYYAGTSKTVSNSATSQSVGYYPAFNLATVDTDLVAGNIASGVNIFGVAGNNNVIDTTTGTATAADILTGKVAWVDGLSVSGTISPTVTGNLVGIDADLATGNIKSGKTIFGVAGSSNVVDTSTGTIDSTARIRSGYTAWSDGTSYAGSLANCGAGGTACYASGGKWYASEAGESTSATQTNVYVDGTARYITTDLCNAAKENQCFVSTSGGYYAFGGECADSTTGTKTNCYVDTTAKYVDSNACSATSNTGYCYMNTSTLSGKDADLAAGNILSGKTVFGVAGSLITCSPDQCIKSDGSCGTVQVYWRSIINSCNDVDYPYNNYGWYSLTTQETWSTSNYHYIAGNSGTCVKVQWRCL